MIMLRLLFSRLGFIGLDGGKWLPCFMGSAMLCLSDSSALSVNSHID